MNSDSILKFSYFCIMCLVLCSCGTYQSTHEYDGIYDAQPFNRCGCPGRVLMSVRNGRIQIYGPHPELIDMGCFIGDRWPVWKDSDVMVHQTKNGLSFQIPGEDVFLELPRIEITREEFERFPVERRVSLKDAIPSGAELPPFPANAGRRWELETQWENVYGYGPKYIAADRLRLDVLMKDKYALISLTSVWDEPFGAVFNPTNFDGCVLIAGANKIGRYIDLAPSEQPSLVEIKPGQIFQYAVPLLEMDAGWRSIPVETNDIVFARMKIDVPEGTVVSKCIIVE